MVGKTLVHYEITTNIGRRCMGEVYQAKDRKLGRDVAIKRVKEPHSERFKPEARQSSAFFLYFRRFLDAWNS